MGSGSDQLPLRLLLCDRLCPLHNQRGNAIDDWVDAVAGDADQMRTVKAQAAKAGRAGQLRKQCRIER